MRQFLHSDGAFRQEDAAAISPQNFTTSHPFTRLTSAAMSTSTKDQVVGAVPKRIKELRFGPLSSQDIINQSVLEVCDRELYDLQRDRAPSYNGPLDTRMGISNKLGVCETCGEALQQCNGHFGHVKLALPAFHIGYMRMIIGVLQEICKSCSQILLSETDQRRFLTELRRPGLDNLRKTLVCKRVNEKCRKTKECFSCGAINGQVKKAGSHPLKIVHDQFKSFNASTAIKKNPPPEKIIFDLSFEESKKTNSEVDRHHKKAMDDLNPLRVLSLFRRIRSSDCELLGMDPSEGRPEMFIWQYLPVPPVCIRPSVSQDSSSTEDDLTSKISEIVHVNNLIKKSLHTGQPIQTIMEQWDYVQVAMAMYINADSPGLHPGGMGQSIRGFCQRLKGKQGRFRGNLSGKRVDFSGRTVISPDPNLGIDEVAIPELVAKMLTYPERVSRYNIAKLRERVLNGPRTWPGANYILKKDQGTKQFLRYGKPSDHVDHLKIGDIVERHLEDRDIVLFNRQPSLHKLSILSHYVKVRPNRTFRLNECVCTPYNADFDGDEMNLHVPQTEEARTEAIELMGVKHNLATPKNGEPIISAIQDFITAAYLLSSKDKFYDRNSFANICMYMCGAETQIDLPPPTIVKPIRLWTGKQVFNVMMRPNHQTSVLVNLDAACREYRIAEGVPRDLNENDAWLCIRNSEIMCGVMDKATIGAGKKDSIFYVIMRDYGADAAVDTMNRLSKLSARWLTNQGFSIGINDVTPTSQLKARKKELMQSAFKQCSDVIDKLKEGKLRKMAGCNQEMTMETRVSDILTKVRSQAGEQCIKELSRFNAPLIMANSGSKGSSINVSQMVAVVGQQIIGGKRVADGFQDRTLPHFPKHAREPAAKGFVRNSFFSGLNPTEFFFHAISGREGLVDTAVKTAETGYMSRRLMKALEELSTNYLGTVINSSSALIQFQYGDDLLDPVNMEGKAKPVHFDRTFIHAEATTWNNLQKSLLPWEIVNECQKMLAERRQKLTRISDSGCTLAFDDQTTKATDHHESARDFLQSVEDFIVGKANKLAGARRAFGVSSGWSKNETSRRRNRDSKVDIQIANTALERVAKLSKPTLTAFVTACLQKYKKAQTEPGHAVGAVGAQSIGEPGTQMTLKTFHFAGVAGMSITQGVPRIKEIINASKLISTPVITCGLLSKQDPIAARVVKGRIEKTYLGSIMLWTSNEWSGSRQVIRFELDRERIDDLQLAVNPSEVIAAIRKYRKLKNLINDLRFWRDTISISIKDSIPAGRGASSSKVRQEDEYFLRVESVMRLLPEIPIRGYPGAQRVIIKKHEDVDGKDSHELLVEGYGLKACMTTSGVDGTTTKTNSVMEMREVLGIEAARTTIISEIGEVMGDMDIDPRHMQLLADVMTYKGEVLGITRFGLSKMKDSVLQLASFEKTPDHLFEAAWHLKKDKIEGVSECIIMGQSMTLGTGAFRVVRGLGMEEGTVRKKETVFEDLWREIGR